MSRFTKKALKESFFKLLNERPLDAVTVKDIVEDCGVNRKTFYYHFADIYALLADILDGETKKALSDTTDFGSLAEAFTQLLEFALKNKKAFYHIYNSSHREQLDNYLYSTADKLIVDFIKKKAEGLGCRPKDIKLIADFHTNALIGSILGWIRGGMKDDPKELVPRLTELLGGSVKYTLENAPRFCG